MGLVKNAILGPLIIYALLNGYVVYNTLKKPKEGVQVQDFPKETTAEARDAIIAARKPLIDDLLLALQGKVDAKEFLEKR